jgi:magnesium-transporting ATPase (P-type)
VQRSDVFARVDPEHKLRVVRALQEQGHVAGVTGDGVNDAPALRQADIGVAMGVTGTEVSKEAADLILADDNFATIVRAIREGREIFANIRKFLRYLLTSNTGEVLVVLLGVIFAAPLGLAVGDGLAVPLLATQILWINLVTDGPLALALGVDPPVDDHMAEPPRGVDERVVDRAMLGTIGLVGSAIAVVSLVALDLGLDGGPLGGSGDLDTARTMAFTTLVLAQVANAFSARSHRRSVTVGVLANRQLWAAALFTVAAQVCVVHLPWLSDAFDTRSLSAAQWAVCGLLAGLVLVVDELRKLVLRHRHRGPRGAIPIAGTA